MESSACKGNNLRNLVKILLANKYDAVATATYTEEKPWNGIFYFSLKFFIMKSFKFSFVALAVIIAIGASAFKLPPRGNVAPDAKRSLTNPLAWFRLVSGSNTVNSHYQYFDGTPDAEEEGCQGNAAICLIHVEANEASPSGTSLPDQDALDAMAPNFSSAITAGGTSDIYVKP
jgi:hypothetical protein